MNNSQYIVGVDVGGSTINLGVIRNGEIVKKISVPTPAQESKDVVVDAIIAGIEQVSMGFDILGIGIGVPGLVDEKRGIVYQVTNIPSWDEVHLVDSISEHFGLEVCLTNDANCYVLGEKFHGKGKPYDSVVGITLGTGLGVGLVINGSLHAGLMSCAGELAVLPYLAHNYEHYCSGQFFQKEHGEEGKVLFAQAAAGDERALRIMAELGTHIGQLVKLTLHILSPEAIFFGGSIKDCFPYFEASMREVLKTFPYQRVLDLLVIDYSGEADMALLGASAIFEMRNQEIVESGLLESRP
ncbi:MULTISPECIES: ROK family protein [Reichenbachiella]|uniref:ROK family protein n=1 Tax=Reichenbachiella TaxID=156993 RepID=UPI000C154A3A|nr:MULTISPECIES: ROK family protein [Reichenbachiella]MBU2912900.1 ROK family protein [Reichenbachiella agariperforans]PIB34015.1 hypothetical protein BFP72_00500 [Reichenbachiella sp. 5M10]RJE72791.1 hypothetical protein BGP76_02225 [Reichenbachiella sp. MSK19-1]